tara:strand:+ start:1948 stop:2700 length:753 start_codon:yes stop_codon:yes gene_type:complete
MSLAAAYMFGRKQGLVIPLADFLAAYKFENNYNDSAKTNNATGTGTAFSTVQKIAGTYSALFDYTTTPDYVNIPYSTDFDFSAVTNSKPFTFSMWVYFTAEKNVFFINKRDTPTQLEFQISYTSGVLSFIVFDGQRREDTGSASFIRSDFIPSTSFVGRWINIVGTYDGVTDCKIHVDKVDGSVAANTNSFAKIKNYIQPTVIGAASFDLGNTNFGFKGYIDEAYIFKKELTTEEITYVYDKGIAGQSLI